MNYLVQFQINIFGLMILYVLYLFIRLTKIQTFSKRLIKFIAFATATAIIVEPLTWIFDGMTFQGAYFLEYITNVVLFLMGPIIGGLLLSYVDFRIFKDPKRIYRYLYYQQASVGTLIALVINVFYPIYFRINPETNSYSSGDLKMLHYLVLASIYLYMLYFVLKNIRKMISYEALIYFLCFLIPILGMIVQLFDSKLHFSWTSIVLGLLVIYIFLETSPTEEDFLTRLYNRRSHETYLTHLMQSNMNFGIIIFDLNSFKEINDHYGHNKGDEILIVFAQILKKVFQKIGFVARLGGDEFSVIVIQDLSNIEFFIHEISEQLSKYQDPVIKRLTFSFGYEQYIDGMTMDDLYIAADKKMYKNKKAVKDA
jgi:diguanylate cyclase (GGDEF)-like protein